MNQSVPVSEAQDEDEDYFVVEGNDSDEDSGNINKALEKEEEKEDPKVKASAILKSVFGDDAEDAVSYEGDPSDEDNKAAYNDEMAVSTSVVEETYSVGDDENGKARDSLPFQIAKDLEEDKNDGQKQHQQQPITESSDVTAVVSGQ